MVEGVLGEIAERKRRDVKARLQGAALDAQPTRRSLREALARPGARFIMEVKKASPSGHRSEVGVAEAASAYAPVADAISVLTDTPYFGGSLDDLRTVRDRFDGPILAKDFVIDPRQVTEARLHGADAVLAILALLDDDETRALMAEAARLSMDVLVEVHDERELQRALSLEAPIIGINNRDLRTLQIDLAVTERLAPLVPDDRLVISESGVRSRSDVERLSPKVDAFLVGSSLMAAGNVAHAARSLVYGNVKVCGLTRTEDVHGAADAGATHAGLIFAEASPRNLGEQAVELAADARSRGLLAVGVFQDQGPDYVARQVHQLGLDAVQLHGTEQGMEQLREQLPEACEIWAACGVTEEVEAERHGADRIVYDTRRNGRSGGTGQAFDWDLLAGRPNLRSAFLAGGIGPANARAAQKVGTFGIDLSSGVESEPGRKDPGKLKALFAAIRPQCRRSNQCA